MVAFRAECTPNMHKALDSAPRTAKEEVKDSLSLHGDLSHQTAQRPWPCLWPFPLSSGLMTACLPLHTLTSLLPQDTQPDTSATTIPTGSFLLKPLWAACL